MDSFKFKNEDKLRKLIIKILKNTQGVGEVRDVCSGIEFGVDIVYQKEDIFKVNRLYGMQIKTTNIRSTSNRITKNVKEIIGQLAIAFGHRFTPFDKYLDAIYIVTSGEINNYAHDYIRSARLGFREIFFIDNHELIKFISYGKPKLDIIEEK